ncbi:hypothetical protein EVAR_44846_1 [Eumeta japonica]|uniref:Uncharacterized protein n=1 Tax=Eumeta variegata TaxID=151549 RepID=A0A4C1YM25_EUMVA|nr:hypothetical protein EVAR_44846_1 [Eumeta japonica]
MNLALVDLLRIKSIPFWKRSWRGQREQFDRVRPFRSRARRRPAQVAVSLGAGRAPAAVIAVQILGSSGCDLDSVVTVHSAAAARPPRRLVLTSLKYFNNKNEMKTAIGVVSVDFDASSWPAPPHGRRPVRSHRSHRPRAATARLDESNEPKLDGVASFNCGVPMAIFQSIIRSAL